MAGRPFSLAVLGATGAVGRAVLQILDERDLPLADVRLLASQRSEGSELELRGEPARVVAVGRGAFRGSDVCIFAAPAAVAREWAPVAWAEGCAVVDVSPAFRADADVPLVLAELDASGVPGFRARGIVACPGSAAASLALALAPIRAAVGLERVAVVTCESASGAGQGGVEQLEGEARSLMNGMEPEPPAAIPHRAAFNLVPQVGAFRASGLTDEEEGVPATVRRLLGDPALRIAATSLRAPVFHGLLQAVNVVTRRKIGAAEARQLLARARGVKLLDVPGEGIYPMPTLAVNDDAVLAGRVREDASQPNGLDLVLASDNLRLGAAASALSLAEAVARLVRSA